MKWLRYIIDATAILGAMGGSLIIALNCGFNVIGYLAFLVSGVATVCLMHGRDIPKSLKFIAWFYLVVNVIGLMRY